ncbi:MAG: amino acid ABC transporter permease [Bacillota bacterium]|jgi:polar amino acid transport system permease protein
MEYIWSKMPFIMEGLLFTGKLYFWTVLFAFPLSILVAILKVSGPAIIKRILGFYTWVFRGTPLLLQLYFAYFGLPLIGITLEPFTVALMTFVLSVAAYEAEIIRGGIISIDKGQYEAAKVLGLTYPQTMLRIIIPQTIRRVLPTTCSEAIILVKDTALVATIAVGDLLRNAKELVMMDFRISPFVVVFLIYLLISSLLVRIFAKLEEKYSIYD